MKLLLVNASNWTCLDEQNELAYFCGKKIPTTQQCHETYHPFAWIRFNPHNQTILAGRDHLGLEPFYYVFENDTFIFGSTIPDILRQLKQRPSLTRHLKNDCFLRQLSEDLPLLTETYYHGIYRLKPGHFLTIEDKKTIQQKSFWKIDTDKPVLNYTDQRDYIAHYAALLNEAVCKTTEGAKSIGAEFSGGIDSSMIFTACNDQNIHPLLYTQKIPANYRASNEASNVQLILSQYHFQKNHREVNADAFEPLEIFQKAAEIYASPPPYMLGLLSTNLYEAVKNAGHDTLLSGFGGDELVSHRFPSQLAFPQLWQNRKLRGIGQELKQLKSKNQQICHFYERMKYSTPSIYRGLSILEQFCSRFSEKYARYNRLQPFYCPSLSQYEYHNIQGEYSHELLMQIEYNAILAKLYQFRFAYPLLYPPLLEFCMQLPIHQKLNCRTTRWLSRQYLQQKIPSMNFKTKSGALAPCTTQKCRDYQNEGRFSGAFLNLPFSELIEKEHKPDHKLLLQINAYMLSKSTS